MYGSAAAKAGRIPIKRLMLSVARVHAGSPRLGRIVVRIALGTICVVLAFAAWQCHWAMNPTFHVVASADSPSGNLRCMALERVPPLVGNDDYCFRYEIAEVKSGKIVRGLPFEFSHGSTSDGPFSIKWSGEDAVEVTAPIQGVNRCRLVGAEQRWGQPKKEANP